MTTIYCIRHGETTYNAQRRFGGSESDAMLSEKGKQQVAALGERFRYDFPFDALFVSPMTRAVDTAKALMGTHEIPFIIERDLREIHLGAAEGMRMEDVQIRYPQEMDNWLYHAEKARFAGGESFFEVQNRALCCIRRLIDENRGKTIGLVAHGGLFQVFFMGITGIPMESRHETEHLYNTGVVKMEVEDDGRFRILLFNSTEHLTGELNPVSPMGSPMRERRYRGDNCFLGEHFYEGFAKKKP